MLTPRSRIPADQDDRKVSRQRHHEGADREGDSGQLDSHLPTQSNHTGR